MLRSSDGSFASDEWGAIESHDDYRLINKFHTFKTRLKPKRRSVY